MISFKSQRLQRSDWSESPSVALPYHQSLNANKQIITRSNSVHPYPSINQSQRADKKQCKPLKCCSSIPPLVRGLFLGALVGCLILAIILPLWLIKSSAPQSHVGIATPVLRWNTQGITVAGLVGNPGSASNQLNTPTDIRLTYANNFYVADSNNHRIQKYLFNNSIGTTVAGNGIMGLSSFQLTHPARVLIDSNENLYISDTRNNRIQFWSNGAVNGQTIAGMTVGPTGSPSSQLSTPYGTVLHPTSGTIYIADFGNHRIMTYPSGVLNGTLLIGGQGPGTNKTQLYNPVSLYYESWSSSLFIVNFGAHNIVRYVFGTSSWTLVAGNINGTSGADSASLHSPTSVTFDPMGNMYVADSGNSRIQFFSGEGMNGTTIVGITGINGSNAAKISGPRAVRLDSQLNLYVTDTLNHRIQKFLRY